MVHGRVSLQQLSCNALNVSYHSSCDAMPAHIWEAYDTYTQYLADWTVIKAHKRQLIRKNNIIENSKCIPYQYKVGDMMMLENHCMNKHEQPYKGPYLVMQGTVHLKIGAVMDTMNIRCIHPYKMTLSSANHGGKCSMCHSIVQAQHMS